MASEQLNVIALISGGKDSFYSVLHCLANGHRVVALANLFPTSTTSSTAQQQQQQQQSRDDNGEASDEDESGDGITVVRPTDIAPAAPSAQDTDLNSFMYQTVGHQVIPLYAAATGLPVYRRAIVGGALNDSVDYEPGGGGGGGGGGDEGDGSSSSSSNNVNRKNKAVDETESMLALLRAVKARHPSANAVCAGAILSTYQRTRVESVAIRLGLLPLAFLWKYPTLPTEDDCDSGAPQLLRDMAAAGLEARIVKVASAGLDERFLWECVSSEAGAGRVARALLRFGGRGSSAADTAAAAAVLGEGGEFETLVVDGPAVLFKRRIEVPRGTAAVVHEGGGSAWLNIGGEASVVDKEVGRGAGEEVVRRPTLFDKRFQIIMDGIEDMDDEQGVDVDSHAGFAALPEMVPSPGADMQQWAFMLDPERRHREMTISQETAALVDDIQGLCQSTKVVSSDVLFATIVLRSMADFSAVNAEYGRLFTRPNPPSRVTVSCGSLLPTGCGVAIYLTLRRGLAPSRRRGLHVQSRSYWAPANIGPYSQAILVPLFSDPSTGLSTDASTTASTDTCTRQEASGSSLVCVLVAGQIPLVPATMTLPQQSPPADQDPTRLQTILSLQHLWRIGVDTQVQLWTSAVAYFARTASRQATLDAARLAALTWSKAHTWKPKGSTDEEEWDGGDVDPWDMQYNNSNNYSEGGGEGGELGLRLPDRTVFAGGKAGEEDHTVPPFFAVEVEELPRQASVEWHAHMGLANVPGGVVQMGWCSSPSLSTAARWESKQVLVRDDDGGVFVHGVVYVESLGESTSVNDNNARLDEIIQACIESNARALAHLSNSQLFLVRNGLSRPSVVYVDTQRVIMSSNNNSSRNNSSRNNSKWDGGVPVIIPCRSVWGGARTGSSVKQLVAVGVFRSRYVVAAKIPR